MLHQRGLHRATCSLQHHKLDTTQQRELRSILTDQRHRRTPDTAQAHAHWQHPVFRKRYRTTSRKRAPGKHPRCEAAPYRHLQTAENACFQCRILRQPTSPPTHRTRERSQRRIRSREGNNKKTRTMNKYIKTLSVIYESEISNNEIIGFRGAVIKELGNSVDILYHNHEDNKKYRYAYPLIQYKRIRGNAAIVAISEGADVIGQFLAINNKEIDVYGKKLSMNVFNVIPSRLLVQTWERKFKYHLARWAPLNAKNYQIYQSLDNDIERKEMLKRILIGNILSFLKGIGVRIENEILINIIDLSEPYFTTNKNIKLTTFNVDFESNITIPNNIGIGKNASIGYGIIHEIKNRD